eukprot:TRINITY_DN2512_c0_g1_i4.p1 TRINITY_DN2512_c0_g1~~TRINITY_DN2512_c0_g1_i4.p1  ORF type:complete len:762 (-),score=104.76 TRINITY_DN2512_c0_g1_i4:97-2382(-)
MCNEVFCYNSSETTTQAVCEARGPAYVYLRSGLCAYILNFERFTLARYSNICLSHGGSLWPGTNWKPQTPQFGTCSSDTACVTQTGNSRFTTIDPMACTNRSCSKPCSRCVPRIGYDQNSVSDGICINVTTRDLCPPGNYFIQNNATGLPTVVCLFPNITQSQCGINNNGLSWFTCRGSNTGDLQDEFEQCPFIASNSNPLYYMTNNGTRGLARDYFRCFWSRNLTCRTDTECLSQGVCMETVDQPGFYARELYVGNSGDYGVCKMSKNTSMALMQRYLTANSSYVIEAQQKQFCYYYLSATNLGFSETLFTNNIPRYMTQYFPYNDQAQSNCVDLHLTRVGCLAAGGEWVFPKQSISACNSDADLQGCAGFHELGGKYSNQMNRQNCDTCKSYPPFLSWTPLFSWVPASLTLSSAFSNTQRSQLVKTTTRTRAWQNNNKWQPVANPYDESRVLFEGLHQAQVYSAEDGLAKFIYDEFRSWTVTIAEAICDCNRTVSRLSPALCAKLEDTVLSTESITFVDNTGKGIFTPDGSISFLDTLNSSAAPVYGSGGYGQTNIDKILSHSLSSNGTGNSSIYYVVHTPNGTDASGSIVGNGLQISTNTSSNYIVLSFPIRPGLLPEDMQNLTASEIAQMANISMLNTTTGQLTTVPTFGDITITQNEQGDYQLTGTVVNTGGGIYFGALMDNQRHGSGFGGDGSGLPRGAIAGIVVAVVIGVILIILIGVTIGVLVGAKYRKQIERVVKLSINGPESPAASMSMDL